MRNTIVALTCLIVGCFGTAAAHACTKPADWNEWEDRNNAAGAKVNDWNSLHAFYEDYIKGMCFHGSVEETYPDLVAGRMIHQWDSLNRYAELSQRDHGFRAFVLGEISSESYLLDDARATYRLARDHCPAQLQVQCAQIIVAALTVNPKAVKAD